MRAGRRFQTLVIRRQRSSHLVTIVRKSVASDNRKTPRLSPERCASETGSGLEQVPQELVVDLVVELYFRGFDEGSEGARATVGGGLFQVGVAAFYVFA